jgi:hypothetical protein
MKVRKQSLLVIFLGLTTGVLFMTTEHVQSAPADQASRQLRHTVMYKFKDSCTPQQIQKVIETFAGLPQKIDTIAGFEHGQNVSQEGKSEGLTHCFVVTFRDQQGLETYLKHPAHQEYVKIVGPCREKVVVFDYWTR